jgi:hypothetical protein
MAIQHETCGIMHITQKGAAFKCNAYTETLYGIIGENLSEERFFPEPLSKDF